MKKPHKPEPGTNQKAPRALKPVAPFERNPDLPPQVHRADRRDSQRNPYSAPVTANTSVAVPGARVNRRAADRLRTGHLWVYASDIEALHAGPGDPPALLPVADSRGLLLGTGLYSPASQIALRMVSREAIEEAGWQTLLETRLRTAIERRRAMLNPENADGGSCRLCFSEADELPGLVIDKYGPLLIVQRLARGLMTDDVRKTLVRVLTSSSLNPKTILERPDPRIREIEGLPAPDLTPLWAANPAEPVTATQFRLNGLVFHYDANAGQKTGAFLDQSANYKAAELWARKLAPGGRALDVCTYQGGFALHLAQVCQRVTGIDASRASLEVAEKNFEANREHLSAEVDWVEGDAFEVLRDWSEAGERFDTIVLDPPAFAKTKRAVEGALRGYKELNLRALKMLRPGGLLVTCTCSHHVSWAEFEAAVASAAADAHRRVRLLERRGAAPDHPVVLNLPETEYLKCLVLEVE
ncbi:MAG TPA: class I SAM-dependent rRNA methyltransferase [Terracidiphilus sp.]|nr:class I SAM-dependent rRNA methyltransferase [Terracidiphilus sp.]